MEPRLKWNKIILAAKIKISSAGNNLAVCKKSVFYLRPLRHIRSFLTEDMTGSIAKAMVLSRLDYANSLLFGCSAFNTAKLQRVHTKYRCPCCFRHTPSARYSAVALLFHLLTVHFHINYKIDTLTCKVLTHNQLLYLSLTNSLHSCSYPSFRR